MAGNRPEQAIAAAELASSQDGAFIRFPDKPYPHSMLLVFEEYDYGGFAGAYGSKLTGGEDGQKGWGLENQNRQSGISLRSTKSIELPFPRQLQDATTLIYNDMKQNPLIEGAALAIKNAGGDMNKLGDIPAGIQNIGASMASAMSGSGGLGSAISSAAKAIKGTGTADAASAALFMLRKFLPDELGQSVNLAMGQTLNPRETIAFSGVQLKTHQFNWDLYPSNKEDSGRIQDIIKYMKSSVLPVTRDIGVDGAGIAKAFLQFPHVCKIYLIGIDSQYFMKFKPAMVTSMTVDYGAGGNLAIMQGGRPAGVNIAITLQELQIETAEDYGRSDNTVEKGVLAPTDRTEQEGT